MARLHSPSCVLLSAGCEAALLVLVCVSSVSAAIVRNAAFMAIALEGTLCSIGPAVSRETAESRAFI